MESIIAAVVLVIGAIGWSIADGVLAGLKSVVSDAVKAACKKLAALIASLFHRNSSIKVIEQAPTSVFAGEALAGSLKEAGVVGELKADVRSRDQTIARDSLKADAPAVSSTPTYGKRWKIITLASASVIAALLGGGALYLNQEYIAPEQAGKIANLVRTAAGRQASAMSPQECGELVSAARGLAGIDPRRLDQSASQALTQAHSCSERIRASDTKLAMLVDAGQIVSSAGADPYSCSTLAAAVAGLDSFDKNRVEEAHKRAITATDICRPVLRESDGRLAEISRRASAVNLGTTDLLPCEPLVTSGSQLSQPDLQRLRAKAGGEFDKLTACTERLRSSDSRIAGWSNAVDAFDPEDPDSAMSLAAARSGLQGADIARLDPAKRDKMQSASARAAALLRDSDGRIAAFVASFKEWQRNPTQANATAFDRSAQLTDFDRKRPMSAEVRNAQSALSIRRQDLSAQAERWSLVERLTAAAERQSPADYFQSLSAAVGALTQRDKENATAKQNQSLERAILLIKSASPRTRIGEDFGIIPGPAPGSGQVSRPERSSAPASSFGTIPSNR